MLSPEGIILGKEGREFLNMVEFHATNGMSAWRSPDVARREALPGDGMSLYAVHDIAAQSLIAVKQGSIRAESTIKTHAGIIRGTHQQIGEDMFLTGTTPDQVRQNVVGYDHSCNPNAKIQLADGFAIALLVARTAISAGDKVTTDYSVSHTSETQSIVECLCGNLDVCRGVVDPTHDWRNPAFQDQYAGEFPAWLQQKIDLSRVDSSVSDEVVI